jgi:hypothetical protein
MEVDMQASMDQWVRSQRGKTIDLSGVMTAAQWGAMIPAFAANLPAAVGLLITEKVGPDIAKIIRAKLAGAVSGAFTDQQVFERPGYPGTYTDPGLFSGVIATMQTALTGAIALFTPDAGDIGTKITTAIGTAWVDALALFTTAFDPDFGFIGTAIKTALDAIPKPSLPGWMTDLSWITGPLEKVTGLLSKVNAQKAGPPPFTGGASGVPPASATGQGFSPIDYSQIPEAKTPLMLKAPILPAPNTSAFDTGMSKVKEAAQNLSTSTFTAKFDADTAPAVAAYNNVFLWGTTYAAQTFRATYDTNTAPAVAAYNNVFLWGTTYAAQTFTAIYSGDDGPAAAAYTEAFGWGSIWASQVFTASFSVDVSGLWAAAATADAVAAHIAAVMPHSPAKEGPLSRPISFQYIADDAERMAGRVYGSLDRALSVGRHQVGVRGGRSRGGNITVNNVLKSKELIRWIQNSEEGASFARGLGRELGLSGGF